MKTAFIFSGQGSQYAGMGKELYDNFDCVRDIFDRADKALGFKLTDICFGEDERLNQTEYTQPALLTMSTAVSALVKEKGLKCDYAAGLSLGEYSALVEAGVMDFEEAVCLVRKRGRFMTEAVPAGEGAMCAVLNLDADKILSACESVKDTGRCMIANYNCPGQIVISGEAENIARAVDAAKANKDFKMVVPLKVAGAYHSRLMKPARDAFANYLDTFDFNTPNIPVFTNVTGERVSAPADIKANLIKQVTSTVRWADCVNSAAKLGIDQFFECGPGGVLAGMMKRINKDYPIRSFAELRDFQ